MTTQELIELLQGIAISCNLAATLILIVKMNRR